MSVPERNRDVLPKQNTEVSNEQVLEAILEVKDNQMQLSEFMEGLRSHQVVQTDHLTKNSAQYEEVMGQLGESEAERTKAQRDADESQKRLIEVGKYMLDIMNKSDQNMKTFLNERERKLDEAIVHTKRLGPDMQEAFGRLIQQAATSRKQKLMQTAIIAGASIVGGIIVFLIAMLVWGQPHTSTTANKTTAVTNTVHHSTPAKKK